MMKRFIMPLALVLGFTAALGTKLYHADVGRSYKVNGDPQCHVILAEEILGCNGGFSDCTINVGGQLRTYYSTTTCTMVLKKSP